MTTPASSVNQKDIEPFGYKEIILRGSTVRREYSRSGSGYTAETRHLRPASVSSPVRANGTRAPLGYFNRWCTMPAIWRQFIVTRPIYGTDTQALVGNAPMGLTPVISNPCNAACNAVGLPWVGNYSTYEFPYGVKAQALTKVLTKAQRQLTNLGQTLGEMKQTAGYVTGVCHELLDFVNWVSRTYPKYSRKRLKQLLNSTSADEAYKTARKYDNYRTSQKVIKRWLETQMALKPLLSDIDSSGKALSHLLFEERKPLRLTFKAGASGKYSGVWKFDNDNLGITTRVPLAGECRAHYSLVFDYTPSLGATFEQLGLTNPASLLWELIPWSWAADYAVGVGDWLSSMTRLEGLTFVEGALSLVGRVKSAGLARCSAGPGWETCKVTPFTPEWDIGRFERTKLTSTPLPAWRPALKNSIGLVQMANLTAALSTLGKRPAF